MGGRIYNIIIVKACRHGVSAMPWPSTDNEMKRKEEDGDNGGNMGIVGIIIGENKKRKARRAKLFQRKNGEEKD